MSFYRNIWSNFVEYISTFKPYAEHRDKFIQYFGNFPGAQAGFKDRALSWYNPVSNRLKFNCGYRFCLNVYLSCDHGCRYCYIKGYPEEIGTGKRKPRFIEKLKRDLMDFRRLGMPPGPVHISNSTDPLQKRLESQYQDTYKTLQILAENEELFSEITILTKNPGRLFEREPDYLSLMNQIKEKLNIEITIPFFRDNYIHFEPQAPHPQNRLEALNRLISSGFNVRLRLDPIFPRDSKIQSDEDIRALLDRSQGVQCVISKPLRLVKPRRGMSDTFFDEMKIYYEGGKQEGVEWHSGRYVYSAERGRREMEFLSVESEKRSIPLLHCKETVLVDENGTPVIRHKLGMETTRNESETIRRNN